MQPRAGSGLVRVLLDDRDLRSGDVPLEVLVERQIDRGECHASSLRSSADPVEVSAASTPRRPRSRWSRARGRRPSRRTAREIGQRRSPSQASRTWRVRTQNTTAIAGRDESGCRPDSQRPARSRGVGDPSQQRSADHRAAHEDREVQRHHASAHRRARSSSARRRSPWSSWSGPRTRRARARRRSVTGFGHERGRAEARAESGCRERDRAQPRPLAPRRTGALR